MELLLLVFFCLLTGSEVTFGAEPEVIRVKEGRDVTLPCSLREDITNKKFEWKKDGRQVFLYDDGDHSNNANTGQDQQFVRRVSHFPDKLKSGDASITISNMKVADTGLYTCEFPDLQPRQIFQIVLVVERNILDPDEVREEIKETTVIRVKAARDVTLPCSLREDITNKKFVWMKDGRQVFLYDDGDHSNFSPTGQDQQFVRRVEHFPDDLKSGDASITIIDMKVAETGLYTCEFPDLQPRQTFHIVLVVDRDIEDSYKIKAEAKPYVTILNQTDFNAVLQCEVRGAFPKPELHWEGRAGNKLPAPKPEVTERGGLYDIILNTNVYKTDNYSCVATYGQANRTHAGTYVYISGSASGLVAGSVLKLFLLMVFLVFLF